MATEWVDFKKIKEAVDMQMVLAHYGLKDFQKSGDELRGSCPIHKGSTRSKNFSVNMRRNAFTCFYRDCGARGNILDFVAAMDHCSVREAALKLQEWFKVGESAAASGEEGENSYEAKTVSRGIYKDQDGAMFEVIATAIAEENAERLVIYRELFGEYAFRFAAIENFCEVFEPSSSARFTLLKTL